MKPYHGGKQDTSERHGRKPERPSARAIREEKNLEALVVEWSVRLAALSTVIDRQ
jgi:hypothetical protein